MPNCHAPAWATLMLVLAATLSIGYASAAQAEPNRPIVLSLGLTEISLAPGQTGTTYAVLENAGDKPVTIDSLRMSRPPKLRIVDAPGLDKPRTLAVGDSIVVPIKVSIRAGFASGTAVVLARGRIGTEDSSPRFTATASLKVTANPALSAPTVALAGIPDTLGDGQKGTAEVRLTNTAGVRLDSVELRTEDTTDITLTLSCPDDLKPQQCVEAEEGALLTLNGIRRGSQISVPVAYAVDGHVTTGTQKPAVAVTVTTSARHGASTTTSQAEATTKLSVFGIDALGPFGFTSLFVVPGAVAILVFLLLVRGAYPRPGTAVDLPDVKDAKVMVFVVPLSALAYVAVFYWQGRDLRYESGTVDVATLFGLAASVGAAAWGATSLAYWWRTDRRRFKPGDEPLRVLKRMKLRDAKTKLPTVTAEGQPTLVRLASETAAVITSGRIGFRRGANPSNWGGEDPETAFSKAAETSELGAMITMVERQYITLRWLHTGVAAIDPAKATVNADLPLRLFALDGLQAQDHVEEGGEADDPADPVEAADRDGHHRVAARGSVERGTAGES
jgi:hypothetical protein